MTRRLMFPLFWRMFLSIWLAMALTVVVSSLVMHTLQDREREAIERQINLRDLGREALVLRQTRGMPAARQYLREQGERLQLHLVLVGREGRESPLPPSVRDRDATGWFRHKPAMVELEDDFRLIAWPRGGQGGWREQRFVRVLWLGMALLMMTLACWWIARRVARPLKHMEATAQRITGGDSGLKVDEGIASRRDEVGQLATAFNAMTDQLCSLLDRQSQLLRDISHDLRTPLARQRVAIELASDSGADAPLMASILRQNERLEAMTAQILSLYRVAGQGKTMAREPVNMVGLINKVLGDAADYAEHRGVDCKLEASDASAGVAVLGDAGLLQRAFDNIVQNALDHTPPGRAIQVSMAVAGDTLELAIEDQGPGVDEASLAHLFEPFFRTDQARSHAGWGLGLAIARDVVTGHDGKIEAINSPAAGLRVTVRLPVLVRD